MPHSELWYPGRKYPTSLAMRANRTADFLDELWAPVLDIGEDNPFKLIIENRIQMKIDSTDAKLDFDYDRIPGKYKTIYCFEVIEHLFNPLFFLESLKLALDDNGIIYLSTVRNGCTGLRWYYRHYYEIPDKQIRWLFDRAGLEIVKTKRIRFHEHWWELWNGGFGIRPVLKYFNKTRLYKMRKK